MPQRRVPEKSGIGANTDRDTIAGSLSIYQMNNLDYGSLSGGLYLGYTTRNGFTGNGDQIRESGQLSTNKVSRTVPIKSGLPRRIQSNHRRFVVPANTGSLPLTITEYFYWDMPSPENFDLNMNPGMPPTTVTNTHTIPTDVTNDNLVYDSCSIIEGGSPNLGVISPTYGIYTGNDTETVYNLYDTEIQFSIKIEAANTNITDVSFYDYRFWRFGGPTINMIEQVATGSIYNR